MPFDQRDELKFLTKDEEATIGAYQKAQVQVDALRKAFASGDPGEQATALGLSPSLAASLGPSGVGQLAQSVMHDQLVGKGSLAGKVMDLTARARDRKDTRTTLDSLAPTPMIEEAQKFAQKLGATPAAREVAFERLKEKLAAATLTNDPHQYLPLAFQWLQAAKALDVMDNVDKLKLPTTTPEGLATAKASDLINQYGQVTKTQQINGAGTHVARAQALLFGGPHGHGMLPAFIEGQDFVDLAQGVGKGGQPQQEAKPGTFADPSKGIGQAAPLAADASPASGTGYLRTEKGDQYTLQGDQITRGRYNPALPNTNPFPTPPPPPQSASVARNDLLASRIGPPKPEPSMMDSAMGAAQGVANGTAQTVGAGLDTVGAAVQGVAQPVVNSFMQRAGAIGDTFGQTISPAAQQFVKNPTGPLDAAGNTIRGVAGPAVNSAMQAAGAAGSFLQDRIDMARDFATKLHTQGFAPQDILGRLSAHFPDLAQMASPSEAGAAEIPNQPAPVPGDQAPDRATIQARMAKMGDLGGTPAPAAPPAPAQAGPDPVRQARIQQMIQQLQSQISLFDPEGSRAKMQQIEALKAQLAQ